MLRPLFAFLSLFACVTPVAAASASTALVAFDQKTDLDTLKDTTKVPGQRIVAARSLVTSMGVKIADEFIDLGPKATTPPDLRSQLAKMLSEMKDGGVDKKLVAGLKENSTVARLFFLRSTKHVTDAKLAKEICEKCIAFTADKDDDLRSASVDILIEREYADAVPALEKMLKKEGDFVTIGTLLPGLTKMYAKDPKGAATWEARLKEYTTHDVTAYRNAALDELAKIGKPEFLDVLGAALKNKDWSTRLSAVMALEKLHHKNAIPLIIAAMKNEIGRPLEECAGALERMTGTPLGLDVARWEQWWANKGGEFELADKGDRPNTKSQVAKKPFYADTTVEFLGIPITSKRVIFVVDISGSMQELARGILKNDTDMGEATMTRLDVVKRELNATIDKLLPETMFNVVVFNDQVFSWLNAGMAKMGKKTRDDAKQYVATRDAAGGTNIYDSLKKAFEDPDCDTIYFMSDGQPTYGEETDPNVIREHVAKWNATRHIKIHTVAVGEQLDLLKAISMDAGGEHVEYK